MSGSVGSSDDVPSASTADVLARPPLVVSRLIGLVHVLVFVAAGWLTLRGRGLSGGQLVQDAGAPLLISTLAALASIALWLALTRALFQSDAALRWALLVALLPPLASALTLHLWVAGAVSQPLGALGVTENAGRATAQIGQALVWFALGTFAAALCLSFAASVLAVRSASRAVSLGVGPVTFVACAVAGGGAVGTTLQLPWPESLLVITPVTFGVVVVGVSAAALDAPFAARDTGGAPAALDALNATLLAFAAVALGALACSSMYAGARLGPGSASATAAALPAVQRSWSEALQLLPRAALAALAIPAASAITLGANAERLGRAWRTGAALITTVAVVSLGAIVTPRLELAHAAREAAHLWSFTGIPDARLASISVDGRGSAPFTTVESALVIGERRIRQGGRDLGAVAELDSDAGCTSIARQLADGRGLPLAVALHDATPFRRLSCLLQARRASGAAANERCAVLLVGVSRNARRPRAPFDQNEPFPVAIVARQLEPGCEADVPKVSLELRAAQWIRRDAEGVAEARSGSLAELERWTLTPRKPDAVLLDVEPGVPASHVLAAAGAIVARGGQVFFAAPAEPAAEAAAVAAPVAAAAAEARPATPRASGAGTGAHVEFQPVNVTGSLFPTEVQARMEILREALLRCANEAKDEPFPEQVTLKFVIGQGGSVVFVAPETA